MLETKALGLLVDKHRRNVWDGAIQDVRSHKDLLCNVILFCRAYSLCSFVPMIIWCDHCLLVALWFRFHIELANFCCLVPCLPIWFRNVSDQQNHRTRRKRSGAPHASLIYHLVVVWVVWNNICFFVWHFVMTVMSCFWRYLFVGIALKARPKIWPVGIYNCSVY